MGLARVIMRAQSISNMPPDFPVIEVILEHQIAILSGIKEKVREAR